MRRNVLKGIGFGLIIIMISILAMYLALSHYYGDGFSYGTWINGIYCTGKSINEVNGELLNKCNYEGLTILDRDGKSYEILPEDVNLTYDYSEVLTLYLQKQNPYLWVDNMIGDHSQKELEPVVEYNVEAFQNRINQLPFLSHKEEQDRQVRLEKGKNGYELVNERFNVINNQKANEVIKEAFDHFKKQVDLKEEGCYSDLVLTQEMQDTIALYEKIREYQNCKIVYQMGDVQLPINGGIVCEWIKKDDQENFILDEAGNLCTNEEKVFEFIDKLCSEYDTVGGIRHFQSTRGDMITVEGGIYGNKLDRKAEKEYLLQAFLNKKQETHIPAYLQKAFKQGKDDIGDTYIEIDMTEQMMYYYLHGEKKLETPVVTGNTSLRRGTPEGTNYVYNKQRNRVLRGEDYASPVKYWIPVIKAVGIHDASWRKDYGGEIYKKSGSHGCINTPLEIVSQLYELVEIGTPVIMFY